MVFSYIYIMYFGHIHPHYSPLVPPVINVLRHPKYPPSTSMPFFTRDPVSFITVPTRGLLRVCL